MATASTTTVTKTVTLVPGESFTLPPGGELIYTSDNNSISSDCPLPPTQTRSCYIFTVTVDADDNTSHPMDETDALFNYVEILGVQYDMGFTINRDTISMYTQLVSTVPQGLLEVVYVDRRIFSKRNQYWVTIRAIESIAESAQFKVTGRGYEFGAFLKLNLLDTCTLSCDDDHTCYDGATLVDNS